jgi:glycosyltransferase involved in cell wall biosynthesis
MIVVTTLYNAEKYIEKCISSLITQTYKDFTCYITDDMSTDSSVALAKAIIKEDPRFILIENKSKLYQTGNYDQVIRNNPKIDDNEVIVELDGDDWLPDVDTLQRIHDTYQDETVWIANGSFVFSDGKPGFAAKQINFKYLRTSRFTASHIRTWKAFLWRKIKQEDLKDEEGNWWKVTGDLAFMFPMLEMAGEQRYKFMKDINYVYNELNPINEHKVYTTNETISKIRKLQPYNLI